MGQAKNNPNSILKKQGRENEIEKPKRRNRTKQDYNKAMAMLWNRVLRGEVK